MMEFTAVPQMNKRKKAELIVLPFWQDSEKASIATSIAHPFQEIISSPLEAGDFKAKEGEISLLYPDSPLEARLVLLGLGVKSHITVETLRRSFGALGKFCQAKKVMVINLVLPLIEGLDEKEILLGVSEGMLLTNYAFTKFKKESTKEVSSLIQKVNLIGASRQGLAYAQRRSKVIEGVYLARDLVNSNAEEVTPQYLANLALDFSKQFSSVKTKVLGKKEIQKEGLGLLLAVNQGSQLDPALIVMEYRGNSKSSDHTVIVGKGITYDTGGLNLKPTGSMETMRCDMSGAATCFGLVLAVASLEIKKNITFVIPSTENMIGPGSYKPGDVFTSALGKTVEIDNTDAEGRLVLADAFTYANKHLAPTRMIDLATLTGGILIALGEEVTGMMGNDKALLEAIFKAGEASAERVWQLPLYEEYRDQLKSDIADIKNSGGRYASSITAAIFLKEFVGSTPWVHLDIAGTAYLSKDRRYSPKNGTGVGVRLLFEFLEAL